MINVIYHRHLFDHLYFYSYPRYEFRNLGAFYACFLGVLKRAGVGVSILAKEAPPKVHITKVIPQGLKHPRGSADGWLVFSTSVLMSRQITKIRKAHGNQETNDARIGVSRQGMEPNHSDTRVLIKAMTW